MVEDLVDGVESIGGEIDDWVAVGSTEEAQIRVSTVGALLVFYIKWEAYGWAFPTVFRLTRFEIWVQRNYFNISRQD